MNEKILEAIASPYVYLSIISLIIDSQRISNEGMQFLYSQELSHVTYLYLGNTIDIKMTTIYLKRECFTSREPTGKV
jgi:hypothetical protein